MPTLQVIHLQQNPNSEDRTPGLLLWPVEESLLIEPHPHGNRIDSGFVEVNGAKYQGSIVYDSLGGQCHSSRFLCVYGA